MHVCSVKCNKEGAKKCGGVFLASCQCGGRPEDLTNSGILQIRDTLMNDTLNISKWKLRYNSSRIPIYIDIRMNSLKKKDPKLEVSAFC